MRLGPRFFYHYKNTLTPLRFSRIRHLYNRKSQQSTVRRGNKGQEKESGKVNLKFKRKAGKTN